MLSLYFFSYSNIGIRAELSAFAGLVYEIFSGVLKGEQ
ncbi:hypothetical protein JCM19275_1085 [Nonlabens ulvanivorans]|uniref:Uncharacterized protein n=1 Tax=Nonlabens ulvanivorans TaxID=906888 RepID=A0A081DAJ1_NONUL|nr:hypothetical protein JCM19296_1534 [Nonlabens ulvanivorans]GAL75046.1 hypothetical protein JCM19275_1085 [Nonlabens ulvanivorans]